MGNKKTPLLQKLRNVGGTLYVFPSATEDIGLNLQSTTTGVAMTHFALLNIPTVSINACLEKCSYPSVKQKLQNPNAALAASLQNYAMNFETILTNDENYNYQKLETVSEKVFWKWARHIGIFNPANLSQVSENIYIDSQYNADGNVSVQDNTLIKCFGAIDAGNQLSTEFGMFNETYINIPTSWGAGPVFMKHSDSDNFKLGKSYTVDDISHLEGRGDSNEYYSYTEGQDYPFFDSASHNRGAYDTYNIHNNDGFEILKDIHQIQEASKIKFNNDEILFDSYDDINIDILNQLNIDQQFEFNTILLYYSVYDQDDLVKTAYATNLFGVIFLDGARQSGTNASEFYIPSIIKRKSTTSQFGNSYSFRVNLKTMSVYDNTDAIIQDNTTMSAVDAVEFSDAISNMNRAIDIMNSNLTTTMKIQDQYASILNYYDGFENDLRDLSTCINAYLKGTRSSFIDTSVLYTNEIRTTESENGFIDNMLLIKTHDASRDENGNAVYNNSAVTIKDNNVTVPVLYNTSMWNKTSYIISDTNINDPTINSSSYSNSIKVQDCIKTIDKAFSENGFNIKMRVYDDSFTGQYSLNEVYIDPESPIFNKDNQYNLRCILDENNNINYIQIIPYIINKLNRISEQLNQITSQLNGEN